MASGSTACGTPAASITACAGSRRRRSVPATTVPAPCSATIVTGTADALPPLTRLERFVVARSTAVGQQLGILRLVLSEQFVLALPQGSSAKLAACVQRTRSFLVACLRDGQAAGQVRADLSAETLAPIVMGTVQMLALSAAGPRQRTAESAAVRATLLALLAPCPGAAASR